MYIVKIKAPDAEPFIHSKWSQLDRAEDAADMLDEIHKLSDVKILIEQDLTNGDYANEH